LDSSFVGFSYFFWVFCLQGIVDILEEFLLKKKI